MKRNRVDKGIIIPIVLVILVIIMILGYSVYNYSMFERVMVVRFRFTSIAEKMSLAAATEAVNWFKYKVLTVRTLDSGNDKDRFVLAALNEKSVNGLSIYLTSSELKSFSLIESLGGRLDSVMLKFEGFSKYFNDPPIPSDYGASGVIPSDPFERFGNISVTARVTFRGLQRVYNCVHEIKVSNTLVPVLSKFTLFTADRDESNENQLVMSQPIDKNDIGGQGIVSDSVSPLRVPLILVHHPDDAEVVNGYRKNYGQMRELLPIDRAVTSTAQNQYRPSMTDRGWVYLGCENPQGYYMLKASPGRANPDYVMPFPSNLNYRFYGNAFMFLESDVSSLVYTLMKGKVPYQYSFTDVKKPPEISDFIVRLTHTGIYWLLKDPKARPIIGNYMESHPNYSADSSLLQISGDVQPLAFGNNDSSRPSKYLDRRSPTIVFGRTFRSFVQVGNVAQNTVHNPQNCDPAHINNCVNSDGTHVLPYVDPPEHPRTTFLPYFNIDDEGRMGRNPVMDFDSPDWGGYRVVNDTPVNSSSQGGSLGEGRSGDNGGGIGPRGSSGLKEKSSGGYSDGGSWTNSAPGNRGGRSGGLSPGGAPVTSSPTVAPPPGNVDFARTTYDVDAVIFNIGNTNNSKTYSALMTKIITESYNNTYNWIVSNSKSDGFIRDQGERSSLKQNEIKIVSAYPDSQPDSMFFYGQKNAYGNCILGQKLKISQYKGEAGNYDICGTIFQEGLFRGTLGAFSLCSEKYRNPLTVQGVADPGEYDLRQKANYIFSSYADFAKTLIAREGNVSTIREGGVYYIDSDSLCDFSEGGSVANLVFHDNTLIMCRGGIRVPDVTKSQFAAQKKATLSLVAFSSDIIIAGGNVDASLNSLRGTVRKETDYFQVFGNMTMNKIYFNLKSPGNLFRVSSLKPGLTNISGRNGVTGFHRLCVTYDPGIDICNYDNYRKHYKYFVSAKPIYWRYTGDEKE